MIIKHTPCDLVHYLAALVLGVILNWNVRLVLILACCLVTGERLLSSVSCIRLLNHRVALDRLPLSWKLWVNILVPFLHFVLLLLTLVALVANHSTRVWSIGLTILAIYVRIQKVFYCVWEVFLLLIFRDLLVKVYLLRGLRQRQVVCWEQILVLVNYVISLLIPISCAMHWVSLSVSVRNCFWLWLCERFWSGCLSSLIGWFPYGLLLCTILLSIIYHDSLQPFRMLIGT